LKSYGSQLGGHAVNLVGYEQSGVYVMNQWGKEWGAKGFAIMPWDIYLKELMYGAYISGITF
jgi:C1A family cysteine protease